MKKALLGMLLACSASLSAGIKIENHNFFAPAKLGNIKLYHGKKGFYVKDHEGKKFVQPAFVDKKIRNMSTDQLRSFLGNNDYSIEFMSIEDYEQSDLNLTHHSDVITLDEQASREFVEALLKKTNSAYLAINQTLEGDYTIQAKMRMLGAGGGGAVAGAYAGKFMVHLIAQAGIITAGSVVAIVTCNPAAGIAVGIALEKTITPTVEIVSTAAALAGGIAGGVATGPV